MKKRFLIKAATILLSACLSVGTVMNLTACDLFGFGGFGGSDIYDDATGGNDWDTTPDLDDDWDTTPEDPDGGSDTTPEEPDGGSDTTPEEPDGGSDTTPEEPEEEEPKLPTKEEIIAALDTIYGYRVNNRGTDYIRDEQGNPIAEFKSDELYETVMERLNESIAPGIIDTTFIDSFYSNLSNITTLYYNYNESQELLTIVSLCEYEKPEIEDDKYLKVVEVPVDISSNSFIQVKNNLKDLKPKEMEEKTYIYKVSNLDYETEEYFRDSYNKNANVFLDKCVKLAYADTTIPAKSLILFQDYTFEGASFYIGNHYKIDIKVITFGEDEIVIDNREVRSSAVIGNGWVENVCNYETDIANGKKYVVIFENGTETITNVGEIEYNQSIINKLP